MFDRSLMRGACLLLIATVSFAAETMPERGICAHRGENGGFPENTVPGFLEAVRLGAAQIEFDVKPTKDGRLVVMHDVTVDRTTDGKGKVSELTFEEIRALDAGIRKGERFAGTKVPTFDEVIDCLPKNIWINIHFNGVRAAEEITKKLIEKDRLHQAFLACDRQSALAAKKISPTVMICNMQRHPDSEVARYIRDSIEWQCDFVQLARVLGSPEDMRALKEAGIRVNFFWAKNPSHFRELVEAGVDFPLVDDMSKFLDVAERLDTLLKE